MTAKHFAAIPHVLMTLKNDNVGFIDRLLEERSLKRRVAMTVDQFTVIPHIVSQSDYIAVCPHSMMNAMSVKRDIVTYDIPFITPSWAVDMIFSKSSITNPLVNWAKKIAHTLL
jgi:DNA-binding transcriptional LysR family regulator